MPKELGDGLAPKTVRNILNMLHEMLGDAVARRYLEQNPAAYVNKPRVRRKRPETSTAEELGTFLAAVENDTTGMRRSELAGAERRVSTSRRGR